MHKLGDIVTTEEEEEKFRRIKEKIRSILTARRNLYNAGVELLECDRVYAEGIKAELERHIFVSHTVPFVGAGAIKSQLTKPMFASILKCGYTYMSKKKCSLLGYNLLPFQRMYARYMTDIPNLPGFRLFLCLMYRIF